MGFLVTAQPPGLGAGGELYLSKNSEGNGGGRSLWRVGNVETGGYGKIYLYFFVTEFANIRGGKKSSKSLCNSDFHQ